MIELPDDFRDVLTELADANAEFVVIGFDALVANKRAARREQDIADVKALVDRTVK